MKTIFYTRDGKRTTRAKIESARDAFARAKRDGFFADGRKCSVQHNVAAAIAAKTAEEFSDQFGTATWKKIK